MVEFRSYILLMKVIILLAVILCLATSEQWALLVAGSNTFSNYRHQADVFHAYQTLTKNGFDKDHIITFAYDDIANSVSNPYKGKVYNKPTYKDPGVDVYEGVRIDYKGADVTPENFLAVLEGNSTTTKGKKVLTVTPEDNIFIFFSDHGAPGLIAFPSKYLYADQLIQTFNKITGKFGKLVFYLETCESGSMFQKLPTNTHIYGLSAANPTQSSWGTYCSPDDVVSGKHVGSCLGDLFSVNFLEDIDKGLIFDETLLDQFNIVKKLTSLSHVMQWGDLSFQSDKVSEYVAAPKKTFNLRTLRPIQRVGQRKSQYASMNSRTMKLQSLSAIYSRDHSPEVFQQMTEEMVSMQRYDSAFEHFDAKLQLNGEYDSANINFDCYREVMNAHEQKCGKLSDYGLKYAKNMAEACEKHETRDVIASLKC